MILGKIKNDTCIICDEKFDKHNHIHCEIKLPTMEAIGNMYMHKKMDCIIPGTQILLKEMAVRGDNTSVLISVHSSDEEIKYVLVQKNNIIYVHLSYQDANGRYYLLDNYKKTYEGVRMDQYVSLSITDYKKTTKVIPIIVSKYDPLIPSGALESAERKQIIEQAKKNYNISMKLRGNNKFEYLKILSDYTIHTSMPIPPNL